MPSHSSKPAQWFKRTSQIFSMIVCLTGLIIFCGWIFNVSILKSLVPGFAEAKANTAIAYFFAGLSLWFINQSEQNKNSMLFARVLAALVLLIGGTTFLQYLLGLDFGIDRLLFYEQNAGSTIAHPGRMARTTAGGLVLISVALLTLQWETKRGHRPAQYLSLLTLLLPIQALTAYSYGVRSLLGESAHFINAQMSPPAALALTLLSMGCLFAVPDRGLMNLASHQSYAGSSLRRLMFPALLIPFLLGYIVTLGFNFELYDAGFGYSALAIANVTLYVSLIWWNAYHLSQRELQHTEDLKDSEDQIRQLQKMEAIGRLASGVAHDFNNILAIIGLYSESLFEGLKPNDPLRANAEQVTKAVQKGATLTKQLLAFSRQQVVKPKLLKLNEVVVEFRDMLRRLIGENIELVTDLDKETAAVMADPTQIEQIIMNLAVNAKEAMPNGGRLIISTQTIHINKKLISNSLEIKPGTYVLLNITDTGVGMTNETKEQIFEPFFTTKEVGRGTGLGLSTVYGMVKKHNGAIWVYSELGQGSSFKIYLPSTDQMPIKPEVAPDVQKKVAKNHTILIAEDEHDLRGALSEALKNHGFQIIQATDGADGLKKVEECDGQIDLLVTDVMMPKMTGPELAKAVNARWPNIKVLFLSGYAGDMFQRHGGYTDKSTYFLEKPFLSQDLILKTRDIFVDQK